MKPVTHHIELFTLDRVESIRTLRMTGLLKMSETHRNKPSVKGKGKGKSSKARGRSKKVEITMASKSALAGLDEATRKFLEANM